MDWRSGHLTIVVKRGFDSDFLKRFRIITAEQGSACGRAVRYRRPIVIEDVRLDPEFKPYVEIAISTGFCAVQSTPMISSSGAFLGVVSTHFPARHRPADREMAAVKLAGELAANAIIRHRALQSIDRLETAAGQTATAQQAIRHSYDLLLQLDRGLKQRTA
jgi:GAF domain-containing protein